MRTSLARLPSSYTPDQLSARQEAYERDLWHQLGKRVIDPSDPRWSFQVRLEIEADSIRRFGKRKGTAA